MRICPWEFWDTPDSFHITQRGQETQEIVWVRQAWRGLCGANMATTGLQKIVSILARGLTPGGVKGLAGAMQHREQSLSVCKYYSLSAPAVDMQEDAHE